MAKNTQAELFEKSKRVVPGGVHSPVRSFKGLHTTPRFVKKARGAFTYDTDDKEYIDFCMSFGPLILGHRNEQVQKDLVGALDNGWSYGACEPYSLDLAEYITERISFIDQVRFVNSGTEAVMTALRLAKGFTGRSKILKFNGCYHGHVDSMLIKAGSGLAGEAEASSKGIPESIANDTLIVELGDKETIIDCFKRHSDDIAAIIVEPLPANNGLMPQSEDFLNFLREITKEHGSLLIFDEVISGFRIGFGGMAEKTGITPDIVTYGKVIGGGLPVGALGAKENIMSCLAPVGQVYQAGTLSANPLAMVGGISTLKKMTPEAYEKVDASAQKVKAIFEKWFNEYKDGQFKEFQITVFGSLFWIVPVKGIDTVSKIPANLTELFYPLFETLLDKGIYLSPNAYEVGFCSLAHDESVLKELEDRLWN